MRQDVAAARRGGLPRGAERDCLRRMIRGAHWTALMAGALVAGCVAPVRVAPPPRLPASLPAEPAYGTGGLTSVIGHSARALVALFGDPDLDIREGPGRKLQFVGPICVLDAYLYAAREGAEAVVTHVDARLPDGRDMDRASCVAALSRRPQAR